MEQDSVAAIRNSVLLHTCCAPCSCAIIEFLFENKLVPVVFYSNSNIFPYSEYCRRRDECTEYCAKLGIEFVEDEYDHSAWLKYIEGYQAEPERGRRCERCFKYRMLRAGQYARQNGFSVITTSLSSSRWKDINQINEAGLWAMEQINERDGDLTWWDKDWKKGGLQQRRSEIIKQERFYLQQYCGCEFSIRKKEDIKNR